MGQVFDIYNCSRPMFLYDQYLIKDQHHMTTLLYCIFQKGPQEEYYNPAETLVNGHFWGSVSREFPVERGSVVERPTFVEELSTCLFNSHC